MKILILNWRDIKHPLAGGAEVATHEHAKAWVKAGHKVTQFSSSFTGAKKEEFINGVKIIRGGNHYLVHLKAFIFYMKYLRKEIDLVVDEFHFVPFFTPLYVMKKKLVFIHETAEKTWFKNLYFPLNLVGFLAEPFFFLFYKDVPFMTVSESSKKDLIKFGIDSKSIFIIPNGVHKVHSTKSKEKRPTIIYLGKLAADKGTEDAIDAFGKICQLREDILFWIVGREEKSGYKTKLERKIVRLGIQENVKFFGHVSEKEKFDLLKRAWFLIHPSIKEGWGLTVIEAATQSTPCVAYDTSGLRDSVISGKTGLLVNPSTPSNLSKMVLSLLDNPAWYNAMSKNALAWSRKFDWKDSTGQSLSLVEKLK